MSSTMPMGGPKGAGSFNVERFVTQVIDTFEHQSSLPLAQDARDAVLEPALQHRVAIEDEVERRGVDPSEIQDAVLTLLKNARKIAIEQNRQFIDEPTIRSAMKLECRYFPWC